MPETKISFEDCHKRYSDLMDKKSQSLLIDAFVTISKVRAVAESNPENPLCQQYLALIKNYDAKNSNIVVSTILIHKELLNANNIVLDIRRKYYDSTSYKEMHKYLSKIKSFSYFGIATGAGMYLICSLIGAPLLVTSILSISISVMPNILMNFALHIKFAFVNEKQIMDENINYQMKLEQINEDLKKDRKLLWKNFRNARNKF